MSETTKQTISISVVATICVLLITIIFGLFQILRSADVQASVERDNAMDARISKVEQMQADLTELKVGQAQIMTALGIKQSKGR